MTVASFHDQDSSLLPFCLSSSFRLLFLLSYSNSLPVLHHSQEFSCFCSGSSFQSFVPGARTTFNLSILKLIQNLTSSYTLIELPILSQIFHHSLFPMPHYRNKHNINPPEPRTSVFYSAVRCKFWPNYSIDHFAAVSSVVPTAYLYSSIVTQPSSVSKVLSNSHLLAILVFFSDPS